MFHGGTSISTIHGSMRWSEDLDFLVNPDIIKEIVMARSAIEQETKEKITTLTPGAAFEMIDKDKGRNEIRKSEPGTVMKWTGRWEHPMRIGVVKVKTEFYIAEPESAAQYAIEMSRPMAVGFKTQNFLPAATLETLWADKIMALSARPVMKWRDIYNIGFIMDNMKKSSIRTLFARLKVVSASYGKNISDIYTGLQRDQLLTIADQYDIFEKNMMKWFTDDIYEIYKNEGRFMRYHNICIEQIDHAKNIIKNRIPDIEVTREKDNNSCEF